MAADTIITPLNSQNIAKLWPEISKMFEPLLDEAKTHTIDDVYRLLMGGVAQMWVQWSGKVDVAVATMFIPYPQALSLRMWLAAAKDGDDSKADWDAWCDTIADFAAKNRCTIIEAEGRRGWEKMLGKPVGNIYRLNLNNE